MFQEMNLSFKNKIKNLTIKITLVSLYHIYKNNEKLNKHIIRDDTNGVISVFTN